MQVTIYIKSSFISLKENNIKLEILSFGLLIYLDIYILILHLINPLWADILLGLTQCFITHNASSTAQWRNRLKSSSWWGGGVLKMAQYHQIYMDNILSAFLAKTNRSRACYFCLQYSQASPFISYPLNNVLTKLGQLFSNIELLHESSDKRNESLI